MTSQCTPHELGLRFQHLGINADSAEEAERIAGLFCDLLGLPAGKTPISHMAGYTVEVMNGKGPGEHGHIGLHVNSVEEAEQYFLDRGFTIDESTRRLNPDGTTFLVYLNEQVAGFALHLTIEG